MTSAARRLATRSSVVLATTVFAVSAIGVPAALAAPPTIASFDPTSGPVGTSVEISGGGFNDSSEVTAVTFNGTAATFTVGSNAELTATVPSGATSGPIAVTDSEGTATSSTNFTVTGVPTITSFEPTSGPVGTSVVIRGTAFSGATAVRFHGTSATFTVSSNTRINATVPAGATTGPIAVTTPGGTATSSTNFRVTTGVQTHERAITLTLGRHLIARGNVTATDGFAACVSGVTVRIQRWRDGRWRTVDNAVTNTSGEFREGLSDRAGLYRAVAVRAELNEGVDVCARDRSPRARHRH